MLRNLLYGIPMLDNFTAIIKPEKVHGNVFLLIRSGLVGMQRYEVVFCYSPYKAHFFNGVFLIHAFEVGNEPFPATLRKLIL
jgi:hypothetical protein